MNTSSWTRARSVILILMLALSVALLPQLGRTPAASAAPASSPVNICGVVSGYVPATGTMNGAITISGVTYTILGGTIFTGPAAAMVANGANLCFQLTLNASGQITAGYVTVNSSSTVSVCGIVSGYAPAGPTTAGTITIGGVGFVIVAGVVFTGPAAPTVANGANLCFQLTLNGANQIVAGVVTFNGGSTLSVCGVVSGYVPASRTTNGAITIGGQSFVIVAGTVFTGSAANVVANDVNLCFTLTLNSANQIVGGVVTPNGVPGPGAGTVQLCGVVAAYTPAGVTTAGSITIDGQTFAIAAGVPVSGGYIVPGQSYCIIFTFNSVGQVVALSISPNLPGVTIVCGVFTVYTPVTGGLGTMVIGGLTFPVSPQFVPIYLVTNQVYCFLLDSFGNVIGVLSGIPTAVTFGNDGGAPDHHVGRLLAQ